MNPLFMLRTNVAHCFLSGHKPLIYSGLWFLLVVMDGMEYREKTVSECSK